MALTSEQHEIRRLWEVERRRVLGLLGEDGRWSPERSPDPYEVRDLDVANRALARGVPQKVAAATVAARKIAREWGIHRTRLALAGAPIS